MAERKTGWGITTPPFLFYLEINDGLVMPTMDDDRKNRYIGWIDARNA